MTLGAIEKLIIVGTLAVLYIIALSYVAILRYYLLLGVYMEVRGASIEVRLTTLMACGGI